MQTLSFIVISPMMGFVAGFILMIACYWTFQRLSASKVDRVFRPAQLVQLRAAFVLARRERCAEDDGHRVRAAGGDEGLLQDRDGEDHVPAEFVIATSNDTACAGWVFRRAWRALCPEAARTVPRSAAPSDKRPTGAVRGQLAPEMSSTAREVPAIQGGAGAKQVHMLYIYAYSA